MGATAGARFVGTSPPPTAAMPWAAPESIDPAQSPVKEWVRDQDLNGRHGQASHTCTSVSGPLANSSNRMYGNVSRSPGSRCAAVSTLALMPFVTSSDTWAEVDIDAGTVAVYQTVRAKGDTKTRRSRRVLKLPRKTVAALKEHRA